MNSLKPINEFLILRKNVVILLVTMLFSGVTIYYYYISQIKFQLFISEPIIIMDYEANINNITCHYLKEGDVLPSAEDSEFFPKPNSIFFHETSCRGGLTPRQACAVESAARAHPSRQIHVLFSAPVKDLALTKGCLAKLRLFSNVNLSRVHITEYAKKTPLKEMVARQPFANSEWWIEHTSYILRYLTLYKWGGLYLDTDVIVAKPLTPLGYNWVAKEDIYSIGAGVIAISMYPLGRKFVKALLSELNATYNADLGTDSGTGVITRVVSRFCITSYSSTWKTCAGLQVYGPEYLYPVRYSSYKKYFRPGELSKKEGKAHAYHFWNTISSEKQIKKGSPYAKLAQKYCPTIFKMYGDDFGQ